MKYYILSAIFLAVPLIFSGALHMLIVKKNWLSYSATPIHLTMFGQNKTWRGVWVMLILTIPGVMLAQFIEPYIKSMLLVSLTGFNPVILGVALGLGYVIPELPNSYMKRRLNIPPGELANNKKVLFSFIDQADSAIGCACVYWLFLMPNPMVIVWVIILGPIVHVIVNLLLYAAGLRKHAF